MSNVPTNLIPTRITGLPEYLGSSTLGYMPYIIDGRTYKVQFTNIAAVGAVPSTREINTGSGLGGGGDLSANRTLYILPGGVDDSMLTTTGVTASTYGAADSIPVFTVNAQGRVTGVTDTPIVLSNYVPTSRTITAGDGLTGGGNLSANRSFAVNFSSTTPEPLGPGSPGVSTVAAREDHVHPAVDLSDTTETQGVLPLSRGGTGNSLSPVVGAIAYSSNDKLYLTPTAGSVGQVLVSAGGLAPPEWQTISGAGTVTSVNASGGTTGLSFTGGPITTSGTLTLGGTLAVANGGTGATDAATALTNLGAYPASNPAGYTSNVGTVTSVDLTAGTGISVSGGPVTSSGSITVTNTAPDQVVSLTGAGTTVVTGTYPNFTITSNDSGTGTVTSVAASGGTTGLTFSGSPITTSGTLTLGGTLGIANGGTGATDAATARTNLGAAASGANSDITSLSGITGAISTVDSITFDTTGGVPVGQGQIAWNSNDGTIDIGMGYDAVTQQVGLEQYFRIKASAAITDGQCVMFTGAVGASGVLTGAPATGVTNPQYIMGVATMDIANNGFGYITSFGLVRDINTTGSSVGETWADGDILYYNPAYTGGLTKVEPIAPLPKVVVASVVNAGSGGSGSLFIRVQAEPNLQGLTDVYAPSPISNGQILIGDGAQARWEAATLTAGTNVSITNAAGAITINATDQYSGTVTSVDVSGGTTGLTTSGGPVTSSGTITLAGTLAVANGGTGATDAATALTNLGAYPASNPSGYLSTVSLTTNVTGTLPVANGGTGATTLTANNVLLGNGTSAVQVVAPGTSGNVLTSDGTTWASAAPTGGGADIQEFAASGTWTKPAGAQFVMVECWGAGGGGTSGYRGAAGSNRIGSAGGGGGSYTYRIFAASSLSATETVTIGAGGTGGAARTTTGFGNAGTNGGNTTFGTKLAAYGGGGAAVGGPGGYGGGVLSAANLATTAGGPLPSTAGETTGQFNGALAASGGIAGAPSGFGGGSGGYAGNITDAAPGGCSYQGGAGGGAGGSISSANTLYASSAGGFNVGATGGGGAAGATPGSGSAGGAGTSLQMGGGGGACGNLAGTVAGGAGGTGGASAGGGGGGSATTGANSGRGGNGGAGYCRVYTW